MTTQSGVTDVVRSRTHFARFHSGWVIRRLALGILTLLLVSVLIFGATHALPSDPARAILGQTATADQITALRAKLGLEKPLATQYKDWIVGVLHGDLGRSVASQGELKVSEIISKPLRNSAILALLTSLLVVPISYVMGALAALHRDRSFDNLFLAISLGLVAIPEFAIGLGLVLLLSTAVFHLLPAVALFPPEDLPTSHPLVLVLPVLTLTLINVPYLARLVRASMIDALESEYVSYARLKGLRNRSVVFRHALPNAIAPAIQATSITIAWLVGGIVIMEYLFSYPGLGSTLADAIGNRDVNVIQAVVLIFAVWYVTFNLIADIVTIAYTPRLRTGSGGSGRGA